MNYTTVLPEVSVDTLKSWYFVGIKGVGMTSLAVLLKQAGKIVSGADVAQEFVTDTLLHESSITVDTFDQAAIPEGVDIVVYSGAHQGKNNPLVQLAEKSGLLCVNLAQAVGLLSRLAETIVVCGVGGKSSTSAVLSWMLEKGGLHPSFSVGVGNVPNFGTSGRWNQESSLFVVEGDEYVADPKQDLTPRFLYLQPKHVICTSLNYDHPDVYADFSATRQAFATLFQKIPASGTLVYNADNSDLIELIGSLSLSCKVISVGKNTAANVQLSDFAVQDGVGVVSLYFSASNLSFDLRCAVPGFHNLLNASYAAVLAQSLGVSIPDLQGASASFSSTLRRFEYKGMTPRGVRCFDDYAHHPREVAAIGEALQKWFPNDRRVIAFQPHTYSRTKALFSEFVEALVGTQSEVVLLPIFASAREAFDPSITSEMLAQALSDHQVNVKFLPDQAALIQYTQSLSENTVFITMGAGDIYSIYEQLTLIPDSAAVSQS